VSVYPFSQVFNVLICEAVNELAFMLSGHGVDDVKLDHHICPPWLQHSLMHVVGLAAGNFVVEAWLHVDVLSRLDVGLTFNLSPFLA